MSQKTYHAPGLPHVVPTVRSIAGLVLSLAIFLHSPAASQTPVQSRPRRTLRIRHIKAEMHIDGRLDEPVWREIPPESDFIQTDPDEGAPTTERTEFRMFYDDDKIYIGMKCFDSNPKGILAWLDARDTRPMSDSVGVFLDPFGDRRNGYAFTVHASGHQYDAVLTEGVSEPDPTWDGIWQSGVHVADWGYSVEFAIPFATLRFSLDKPWGFNIRRDIARKNERAYWQFVPRFDQRARPSTAGTIRRCPA